MKIIDVVSTRALREKQKSQINRMNIVSTRRRQAAGDWDQTPSQTCKEGRKKRSKEGMRGERKEGRKDCLALTYHPPPTSKRL